MVHPITDGIDKTDCQMLLTVDDIRESDPSYDFGTIEEI